MPRLRIIDDRSYERTFPLNRSVVTIGRESGNDLQLLHSEVSRRHAEVRQTGPNRFEFFDLDSSNGTSVNGKNQSRCELTDGDQIQIGSTCLIFEQQVIQSTTSLEPDDVLLDVSGRDQSRIISKYSNLKPSSSHRSSDSAATADSAPTDRSLEVIYESALAIGRSANLDNVLKRILELVFDWMDADRGCIMLRGRDDEPLYPAARQDRVGDGGPRDRGCISISRAIADHVLEQEIGVRTSNASEDNRFDQSASIVTRGVREALCVPLQGRYSIVGLLYVDTYTPPGKQAGNDHAPRFSDEHLKIATAIGYQAAIAIEDTRYYSSLLQSERLAAMGQALASLSHDIKNILQGIRGGSYLIEAGLNQENHEAIQRGWMMVNRNQDRISNLVLDMLTFSKPREPVLKEQDLNNLLREVYESFHPRATELGVSLELKLQEQPVLCQCDYESLHRAVLNLVSNALDAVTESQEKADQPEDNLNPGGTVTFQGRIELISRVTEDANCIIQVRDNGTGIPEEMRQRIFDFLESSKGSRGTGIGLPVSAKIIHEHDGLLEVLPTGDDPGTVFQITLPSTPKTNSVQTVML